MLILVTPWVAYIKSVVLWLEDGTPPILFMVAFVSFPAFTFATVSGLRSADPVGASCSPASRRHGGRCCGGCGCPAHFRRCSPPLVSTSASASPPPTSPRAARSSSEGLGWIGSWAISFNNGNLLWAAILCTAVLGVIGLALVNVLERFLLGWHVSQR